MSDENAWGADLSEMHTLIGHSLVKTLNQIRKKLGENDIVINDRRNAFKKFIIDGIQKRAELTYATYVVEQKSIAEALAVKKEPVDKKNATASKPMPKSNTMAEGPENSLTTNLAVGLPKNLLIDGLAFNCDHCTDFGPFAKIDDVYRHWQNNHLKSETIKPFRFIVVRQGCLDAEIDHTEIDALLSVEQLTELRHINIHRKDNQVLHVNCGGCEQEIRSIKFIEHAENHKWNCPNCGFKGVRKPMENHLNEVHNTNGNTYIGNQLNRSKVIFGNGLVVRKYDLPKTFQINTEIKNAKDATNESCGFKRNSKSSSLSKEEKLAELVKQRELRNHLSISNIPIMSNENLMDIFMSLCVTMQCNEVDKKDISQIFRQNDNVIVIFHDHQVLEQVMLAGISKDLHPRDFMYCPSEKEADSNVYINPRTTELYAEMTKLAAQACRNFTISSYQVTAEGLSIQQIHSARTNVFQSFDELKKYLDDIQGYPGAKRMRKSFSTDHDSL